MNLRTRILLARGLLYSGGFVLLLGLGTATTHWSGFVAAMVMTIPWLFQRPQLIRYVLLPMLIRQVRCTNGSCQTLISLTQRWQIGDQYKHHRAAHIVTIHDDRGREIGKFDCPNCKTTIQVQKGTAAKLAQAKILGKARITAPVSRSTLGHQGDDGQSFPLGQDRHFAATNGLERFLRKVLRLPLNNTVYIDEETYGRHMCLFGKSGMGKSTLIQSQVQWMLKNNLGGTVIDPAGDLVDDILRLVPERRKDDVILIRVKDEDCPFRLNLLETHSRTEEMNLNYEMLSALQSVSRSWVEIIAYQMETAKAFNGSLKDVFDLFTKPSARYSAISALHDEELIEFWEKYERLSNASKAPVIRKLRGLVKHKLLGPMLSADSSNLDPDAIIRDRKIVLVDLNTDSTADDLKIILGTFLIGKIRAAALRQDKDQRQRHFLIVDEAVDFMHEGMNFPKLFSQARKHKLSLVLASQHVTQMPDKVKESAFANSGVLVSFNVDLDDAKLFAARMPDVTPDDITAQARGECIARIGSDPYFVKTTLPKLPDEDCSQYIEQKMRGMNTALAAKRERKPPRKQPAEPLVALQTYTLTAADVCEGVR